ncbi:MAG: DUF2764 domain-containing protein [Tannerellaceae bacterium]|nr:DUF2764 domain-containing protein [Tannerellaceae bacterium]
MGKYYYLIAGLPDIELDDDKLTYSLSDFREELAGNLTAADQELIDLFYFKFDNKNLNQQLEWPDSDPDPRGNLSVEELADLIAIVRDEDRVPKNSRIPAYFTAFLKSRYSGDAISEEKTVISPEDQLASLYYDYAMKNSNRFVSEWFELNLNISNILTAITCRKFGLDKSLYIVGHNEVAETLRTSNARDFHLGDSVDYMQALLRVAEENDLYTRERRIDQIKWEWLEENTFFKPFDIESVFAYLLKLEMIERWVKLDKVAGEKTFRELVGSMKKGSGHALDEFKRNNKK